MKERLHKANTIIKKILSLDQLDSMQNIIERPTRPAGNDLRPDLLRHRSAWIQETPVWAGLGLDPFEVFDLAPAVLVVDAVVVQGL